MADLKWVYFSSNGRIARLSYFLYGLILGVVGAVFAIAFKFMEEHSSSANAGSPADVLLMVFALVYIVLLIVIVYCSIVMMIKRLHDLDMSGWFTLLSMIPIVGLIFYIYLLFAKGTPGPNRFGTPPV